MIRKIELEDMPDKRAGYNNLVREELRDFAASDWSAAEIDISKYKDCYSAAGSYKHAARRYGFPVIAVARKGRAFLVKTEER